MVQPRRVVVVGAGISGLACARALHDAGVPVQVLDRGRDVGGRMNSSVQHGRVVDLGASYVTARDPGFVAVVRRWEAAGLARPWTDTFAVADASGITGSKTGGLRWASPTGLRSLLAELAEGLDVQQARDVESVGTGPCVDGERVDGVVLAMPDPQAADLLSDDLLEESEAVVRAPWVPVIALATGWPERSWDVDGVFVNDQDELAWVADDGARRGDGAPVLVAHSTAALAGRHLDAPGEATPAMVDALRRLLDLPSEPAWTFVRRWSLARPTAARAEPYFLGDAMVGLCGDGWHAPSRVEGAWLSGRDLGRAMAQRLV